MKISAVFVAATALTVAGGATAASWTVVKSGSASGGFAVKSIAATIAAPRSMAVRLIGNVSSGNSVLSCSKGTGVAALARMRSAVSRASATFGPSSMRESEYRVIGFRSGASLQVDNFPSGFSAGAPAVVMLQNPPLLYTLVLRARGQPL